MVFSPAWGGNIPLVKIGSFRGFLGQRSKGKALRVWYTGLVTSAVVKTALRTSVGKRFVNVFASQIAARVGFKPSPNSIGIELQAYIAFQKFQYQQATKNNQAAKQRQIERIMRPGRMARDGGGKPGTLRSPFPLGYFETLTKTIPRPSPSGTPTGRTRRETESEDESFAQWFERRKRRKGRLVNA